MDEMANATLCLWYDKAAEEAARFYARTFPNSHVGDVYHAPADYPSGKAGDVLLVHFTVLGLPCVGLNGGPEFTPNEAFSFQVVTADQAIFATREVLVSHGYEIVRVERVQTTRVVYYRRGNMGRGKGKGPIERIVIRPEPDRVVFVSPPPRGLMVDINVRLGM